MNVAKTMATQAETQVSTSHAKGKKQTGGDFLEILSSAINTKNAAARPENVRNPDNAVQPADKTSTAKPAQPLRSKANSDSEDAKITAQAQEETPDETATASTAAQMLAQVPVEVQPDVTDTTGVIPVQTVEQAMPVQTWTAQTTAELQPQAAQAQDTQAVEQAAEVQTAEQKPVYTQQTQSSELQTKHAETGHTAKAAQEQTGAQEHAKAQRRTQSDATTQRNPLPDEAGETVVYAQTARQSGESIKTNTTAQTGGDAAQTRFDGMLAKASQELVQTKTDTVQKQPLAAEEPVLTTEEPDLAAKETDTAVVAEKAMTNEPESAVPEDVAPEEEAVNLKSAETARENNPTAAKRENWQTEYVRTHVPELKEQKPVKAARNDDEADLTNAVQPKTQPTSTHEVVRTEQQQPAQAAKTPDQFEQVRAQVIRNIEDQKMEFNMQLHPQELGKVDVKMVLEGGKLAIEIMAANAKSAEILNKQTEALVASLRLNNLEVTTVNVVTASQSASGHMDGEYNLNNFNGQAGQQEAQSSKAGDNGRNGGSEAENQPEDEAEERQPTGILNYSI